MDSGTVILKRTHTGCGPFAQCPLTTHRLNVYRAMPVNADNAKPTDNRAIVATDLTKWFGESETKKIAVNNVALVTHFT